MKIVGGRNRGRRLKVSKKGIRPTKGIVKEAIFNIIGSKINRVDTLDIFAGSGALGLEALSRGAQSCTFIEKKPKTLSQNIKAFSSDSNVRVIAGDFRAGLRKIKGMKFDIIFLDPPYNKNYIEKTIKLVIQLGLLTDEGIVIAEHDPKERFNLPRDLSVFKEKTYGDTIISFITHRNTS